MNRIGFALVDKTGAVVQTYSDTVSEDDRPAITVRIGRDLCFMSPKLGEELADGHRLVERFEDLGEAPSPFHSYTEEAVFEDGKVVSRRVYAASADMVPEVISDRQFFEAAAMLGHISKQEALDAVKTGEIPATLAAVIDAIPDEDVKFNARMRLSGAVEFHFSHPLVAQLGAALGWTPEQRADLWRLGDTLK